MKNKKNLYILAGVFVLLVIIAYFLTAERGQRTTTFKLDEKILQIDSAAVDKLEIEKNGKKIVLQKTGGNWTITTPVNYPAINQFVNNALFTLKNYKITSKVSSNPSNKDKFGFNDTNITKLTVYQNGSSVGQMLIGNAGPGNAQSYIKTTEGNDIFLADEFVWNYIVKNDLSEWRDKLIVSIPKGLIKQIDFISKDENFSVKSDSTGKFFIGKDTVSSSVMDGLMNLLQNYNTQYFKDTVLADDRTPDYFVRVTANNSTEFKYYKYLDTEAVKKYLLKVSGNNQIFDVDENYVKQLFKTRKELLGKS
ncbi:MAG: DUF4340 domain-containing protein [Ignavibacteria bacterium]|nr:DUF4340 domain-containing protein [Ignavibacteria bacterium]